MQQFATLFEKIDQIQSTNQKVDHLKAYFATCSKEDGAWALFFLSGKKLKRSISGKVLLQWCSEVASLPLWLAEESYAAVGDTAEAVSLLLPQEKQTKENNRSLADWVENSVKPLQGLSPDLQKKEILSFWSTLTTKEIFLLNKILTGSFRVGISALLTLKGLSLASGISRELLSQRLMGNWEPTASFFSSLFSTEEDDKKLNPYPFCLAYGLDADLETLGNPADWVTEWKWDGIRAQAVIRNGEAALWSRGNELISEQFPDLLSPLLSLTPGSVLDGEIVAYEEGRPLPFAELQKRLGRKNVSKSFLEKYPVAYIIYDLLEQQGQDIRKLPLCERRQRLKALVGDHEKLFLSQEIGENRWQTVKELRLTSRQHAAEGIMLKKQNSLYGVGRQKGYWWKYKVDPLTIDAVLIYAKAGSGRRANLFTDYTFGVWQDQELVPITKAYSGLDQKEINALDHWIRRHTEEKFGPVRKVQPFQVFEIAFEGIQLSKRHKSGVALRFPRILRWRKDKPYQECDSLAIIMETFFHEK